MNVPSANLSLAFPTLHLTGKCIPCIDLPPQYHSLQNRVTKRSGVYLADSLLKAIEKDFCLDIVQDRTDTLLWLDHPQKIFEMFCT